MLLHCGEVWINVSSLTPWFSHFRTVQFSGSSGYFLFLNLLSFFGCARRQSVSTYTSILAGSAIWKLFFQLQELGFVEKKKCMQTPKWPKLRTQNLEICIFSHRLSRIQDKIKCSFLSQRREEVPSKAGEGLGTVSVCASRQALDCTTPRGLTCEWVHFNCRLYDLCNCMKWPWKGVWKGRRE